MQTRDRARALGEVAPPGSGLYAVPVDTAPDVYQSVAWQHWVHGNPYGGVVSLHGSPARLPNGKSSVLVAKFSAAVEPYLSRAMPAYGDGRVGYTKNRQYVYYLAPADVRGLDARDITAGELAILKGKLAQGLTELGEALQLPMKLALGAVALALVVPLLRRT